MSASNSQSLAESPCTDPIARPEEEYGRAGFLHAISVANPRASSSGSNTRDTILVSLESRYVSKKVVVMSGLEIISVILALYPVAVDLAKGYRKMKWNGFELHRGLSVTSQRYDKIVKDLLMSAVSYGEMQRLVPSSGPINHELWKDDKLQQKLQDRLGQHKFPLVMSHLTEIKTLLDQVRSELTSISRTKGDVGVLGRFRMKTKMVMASMPHSRVHEAVQKVRSLIDELRALLDETPIIRPHRQYIEELEENTIILNVEMDKSGGVRACEFYEAIKKIYTCECSKPHPIGLGCYCTDCVQPLSTTAQLDSHWHSADQWEFCLAFPPSLDDTLSTDSPAAVLLQTIPDSDDRDAEAKTIHDICSLVSGVTNGDGDVQLANVLIDTADDADTKSYRMKVSKIVSCPPDDSTKHHVSAIKSFAELRRDADLSWKERLELAIRLSLIILQLCKTPWIDDSWTWTDVCVSQVTTSTRTTAIKPYTDFDKTSASPTDETPQTAVLPPPTESPSPVMFFLREIYSATYDAEAATLLSSPTQTINIMDKEPVLTKLGMALIELALGTSIHEMKAGYGLDGMAEADVANFCTARELLDNGRIRHAVSRKYEGVVRACIERQFHDGRGRLRAVASRDASFLASFREAVVLPLWGLWSAHC